MRSNTGIPTPMTSEYPHFYSLSRVVPLSEDIGYIQRQIAAGMRIPKEIIEELINGK